MEEEKKDPGNYVVVNLGTIDENPAYPKVSLNKSGGWVTYGTKNLFPQEIVNFNSKSPVNSSIIESTVTYICGKGVRDSESNAGRFVGTT